jgi:CMP-N-acetylneuraminic acid synthetase
MLGGYPLIVWTIMAGRSAQHLDKLVVSSDDVEILHVARRWGAEPLVRPGEFASDEAKSYPAILHALDSQPRPFDHVCLLQPTSPLRSAFDVDCCLTAVLAMNVVGVIPAVVSAQENRDNPNGAIYVGRADWLRDSWATWQPGAALPFDEPSIPRYYMPASRSIDIDTPEDFAEAERTIERIMAA